MVQVVQVCLSLCARAIGADSPRLQLAQLCARFMSSPVLFVVPSSGTPDRPRHLLLNLMASLPGISARRVHHRHRSIHWSVVTVGVA